MTAIRAAKEAGKIQLKNFQKPLQKTMKGEQHSVSNFRDFATNVDFECEKAILKILQKDFPDYGVLSEEQNEIVSDSNYRWLVDPLDGTVWYAYGLPAFGVMIALEKNQKLELGVLFQPYQNKLLVAQKGKGTYLNGKRVFVSNRKDIGDALVGYHTVRYPLKEFGSQFGALLDKTYWRTGIPWLQGTEYFCNGTLDLFFTGGGKNAIMKRWDAAPLKIVCEEAGGVFSNYYGESELEKINAIMMATPQLHKKVLKILHEKEQSK